MAYVDSQSSTKSEGDEGLMIKKSNDYLLDREYNKKVITAYINIVIPTIIDINAHLNALSPYSENIIKNQDSIPRIIIPTLAPFNSLSTNFFSIITIPFIRKYKNLSLNFFGEAICN